MKGKNPIKAAAEAARKEKPVVPKYVIQIPDGTKKWSNDPSGHHVLNQWIDGLGTYHYSKTSIGQAISQMVAGQGKKGTKKYHNQPIQHASSGSGEGGSGACSIWFAEYPDYTINIMAVGHHVDSPNARYELDWTCGTDWPGGSVGDEVGPSGG